jgi:hypothetical protein
MWFAGPSEKSEWFKRHGESVTQKYKNIMLSHFFHRVFGDLSSYFPLITNATLP